MLSDETTINREIEEDNRIETNGGDGVRVKRVKIEEEPRVKIGNGNSNGPHYKHDTEDSDEENEEKDENWDGEEVEKKRKPSKLRWFREKIRKFVVCDHFTRGILVAILVNTLSMGVEYHQQPDILTVILEYSNLFFTALFALEMLLKIIANGFFGYLSDGFNLFDGGIVALSVLELFQEGKGGLSVLRTFRLLRILKLVRFMPALRYQLVVMLRTMDNVTVFFGLLVLFIFIFRYYKISFLYLPSTHSSTVTSNLFLNFFQHPRNESVWVQVLQSRREISRWSCKKV